MLVQSIHFDARFKQLNVHTHETETGETIRTSELRFDSDNKRANYHVLFEKLRHGFPTVETLTEFGSFDRLTRLLVNLLRGLIQTQEPEPFDNCDAMEWLAKEDRDFVMNLNWNDLLLGVRTIEMAMTQTDAKYLTNSEWKIISANPTKHLNINFKAEPEYRACLQ